MQMQNGEKEGVMVGRRDDEWRWLAAENSCSVGFLGRSQEGVEIQCGVRRWTETGGKISEAAGVAACDQD